jgi:hypothetical protein
MARPTPKSIQRDSRRLSSSSGIVAAIAMYVFEENRR